MLCFISSPLLTENPNNKLICPSWTVSCWNPSPGQTGSHVTGGGQLLESTPQRKGLRTPVCSQKQSWDCVFPACPAWVAQEAARNSIYQSGEGQKEGGRLRPDCAFREALRGREQGWGADKRGMTGTAWRLEQASSALGSQCLLGVSGPLPWLLSRDTPSSALQPPRQLCFPDTWGQIPASYRPMSFWELPP